VTSTAANYYEIFTTAQYTAPIRICLVGPYGAAPTLLHFENGSWVTLPNQQALPASGPPFTQVCATTNSLSPFVVGIANTPPAPTLTRIAPDSGKRGTFEIVFFQGTGLGKKLAVRFSGEDISVIEAVSLNATTAAALIYIKPNAVRGSRAVTVSNAFGTSNSVTFVVR
jgi:hypothetical protein